MFGFCTRNIPNRVSDLDVHTHRDSTVFWSASVAPLFDVFTVTATRC